MLNLPQHEQIVAAGRGDFQGALDVLLAHDLGKVGRLFGR